MKKLNLGTNNTLAAEKIAELFIKQSLPVAVRKFMPKAILAKLTHNVSLLVYRLAYDEAFDSLENPLEVEDESVQRNTKK